MEEQKKTYLRAICHPPPKTDPNYKGWTFRADEITKASARSAAMTDYIGKPVYVQHDKSKLVGRVMELHRSSKGDILCDLWIDHTTPLGRQTLEDLRTQRLSEVSIGFKGLVSEKDWSGSDFVPTEISLVDKGAIPNSKIMHFNIGNRLYHSVSAMKPFIEDISPTPAQTIKKEMQTTPLVAEPPAADPFLAKFGMTEDAIKALITQQNEARKQKIDSLNTKVSEKVIPMFSEMAKNGNYPVDQFGQLGAAMESTMSKMGQEGQMVVEALAAAAENHLILESKYREAEKLNQENADKIKKLESTVTEVSKTALNTEDERQLRVSGKFQEEAKKLGKKEVDVENSASTGEKRSLKDQFTYQAKRIREQAAQIEVKEIA